MKRASLHRSPPRHCYRCGRRYWRRNLFEAWVTLGDGPLVKDVVRICVHCMSQRETQMLVLRVAALTRAVERKAAV